MHTEGAEYKAVIEEIYVLEDDLNSTLPHFFVALERSLMNTGKIDKKIKYINKLVEKIEK